MYVLTAAPRTPLNIRMSWTHDSVFCAYSCLLSRDWSIAIWGRGLSNDQLRKINLKKTASTRLCTAHSFVMMNGMLAADQMACCLCPFVSNALTWYSSPPPFNLFGPEPTLNAQIASFHRDSSVSRPVLLHWAPWADPWSLSPMPWKGGWTCGTSAVERPGTHQLLEVFCLKLFSFIYSAVWVCL